MERFAMVKGKQEAERRRKLDRAAELTAEQATMRQGVMTAAEADQIRAQLIAGASLQQQHTAGATRRQSPQVQERTGWAGTGST